MSKHIKQGEGVAPWGENHSILPLVVFVFQKKKKDSLLSSPKLAEKKKNVDKGITLFFLWVKG